MPNNYNVQIFDPVATYQADSLAAVDLDNNDILDADRLDHILQCLWDINGVFDAQNQILDLDIAGTLQVDGAVSLNDASAALSLTSATAYMQQTKSAGTNAAPYRFRTDHGSGAVLTWSLQNRSDEAFWITRYNSSGTFLDAPIAISNITGDVTIANDLEIDGDLNHDGSNIGFFGTTPAAQAAAYTPTNVTPDRSFDADSTTLAELADIVGTLIADLQTYGLLQ